MIPSLASMVTGKKIARWQARGDLKALAAAVCDLKLAKRRPEVCEAAKKALVERKPDSLPLLLDALRGRTFSSLKGCGYLLEALHGAGGGAEAAPVLSTILEQDPYWLSLDDSVLRQCVEMCGSAVAARVAFAGFLSTEVGKSHPEALAGARSCVRGIESPRDDFERLVWTLLTTRDKRPLANLRQFFDSLGAYYVDTSSFDNGTESAHPHKAVAQYRQVIKTLDSQAAQQASRDCDFIRRYMLERLRQVFANAVQVTAIVSGEYRYPNVCAACLSADVDSLREVKYVTRDYQPSTEVTTKTTTKVSFPVCRRCRSLLDEAVSLFGQAVTFQNPRYGFAFVAANNLREYMCRFGDKHRSPRLADHLARLGLPDMTRGIDWETASAFHKVQDAP